MVRVNPIRPDDDDDDDDDDEDGYDDDDDDDDDDDVHLKKITTKVSQNLIRHKNADQPKTKERESTYK
jgi:hypothetical protein